MYQIEIHGKKHTFETFAEAMDYAERIYITSGVIVGVEEVGA